MNRTAVTLAAGLAAVLLAAGCGGGGGDNNKTAPAPAAPSNGNGSATSGGTSLALAADKTQLKFDKNALSAPAGKVTITMSNPSALQHDVAIEGNGVDVKGDVVGQGGTSTATTTLKSGTYTFYCSVDGHRQAGMQGKLTVT